MITVGITGGIGSGKTTFCKFWEKQGAFVIYADDLAKELMVKDMELISGIKSRFGDESYHEDGSLNRSYLAEEAFKKGRVEELNALVHPVLHQKTRELAREKADEGVEVFAEEAAVLLNDGRPGWLDYVVLLTAPRQQRVDRVVQRDHSDEELVLDRIQKQPDFESLYPLCDFIIENEGGLEELEQKAIEVYRLITEKAD